MLDENLLFSVVLLAGDRISDQLAKISPRNRKALLSVNNQPMILHVLNTLMTSRNIGSIVIVGNRVQEIASYPEINEWQLLGNYRDRINFVEGEKTPATSVLVALKTLSRSSPILVTTADNPLLAIDTLDEFCNRTRKLSGADVTVGLASEKDIRTAFPKSRRTYIRLGGSGYSGCNLFALMSDQASRAVEIWCDVEKRRKRPWQLISYFGFAALLKALLGRLDLDSAFDAVSRSMRLNVEAIVLKDPTAAMDVDRIEHVPIAENVLLKRKGVSATTSL